MNSNILFINLIYSRIGVWIVFTINQKSFSLNPSAARDMVAVSPSLSTAATPSIAGEDKIIYSGEEEVLIAVLER